MHFQNVAIIVSAFTANFVCALPHTSEQSDLLARDTQDQIDRAVVTRDATQSKSSLAIREIQETEKIIARDNRKDAIKQHKVMETHHENEASKHLQSGNMAGFNAHNVAKNSHSNAAKGLADRLPGAGSLSTKAHQDSLYANAH